MNALGAARLVFSKVYFFSDLSLVKFRNLNFAKNVVFHNQEKSKSFKTVCVPV